MRTVSSWPAETSRSPSGLQSNSLIRPSWASSTQTCCLIEVSQILILPSRAPEASRAMCGCQATASTGPVCPSIVYSKAEFAAS